MVHSVNSIKQQRQAELSTVMVCFGGIWWVLV
jgi:hypothetical protein